MNRHNVTYAMVLSKNLDIAVRYFPLTQPSIALKQYEKLLKAKQYVRYMK